MTSRPQTIQIFLPKGDPRGMRVAEITTRIVQVIEVPRTDIEAFLEMPESKQVALYFLFGTSDDASGNCVYIGQTGDLTQRLKSHHKNRDSWERAVVLVSRTNSLTQTHALFLEWHCLKIAEKVGRYALENGNAGSKPHTPAPLEADCMEIFETGRTLLSTLGYPVFDQVGGESRREGRHDGYSCNASGANADGLYTTDGFVVLAGSSGRKELRKSAEGTQVERLRARLVASGAARYDGDRFVFVKDHVFGSPSMAAAAVVGGHMNGWETWKRDDGRTLDDVERGGDTP